MLMPAYEPSVKFSGPVQIQPDEIELGERIASGNFGTVHKGLCRSIAVAVKIPNRQVLTVAQQEAVWREVEIMSKVFHPHVALFMGVCMVPRSIRIVSELLDGTVEDLLKDRTQYNDLSERLRWAKEMAQGVAWLHGHKPPLIHRDLKCSNLLVDSSRRVKVCDFGLSEFKKEESSGKRPVGTPLYMAPEVMMHGVITEKVDVYSMGILVWEMVTRKPAFAHHSNYEKFRRAVVEDRERPPMAPGLLPALAALIERCWAHDPQARPSAGEVVAQLEDIIQEQKRKERLDVISAHIHHPEGADFWKSLYFEEDAVPFRTFFQALMGHLGCPVSNDDLTAFENTASSLNMSDACRKFHVLKSLVVASSQPQKAVTPESWGKFLGWFGPLDKTIVDRAVDLASHDWFHGICDTKQVEHALRSEPACTFLVRFSNRNPSMLCISRVTAGNEIKHHLIPYDSKRIKYKYNDEWFDSMEAVIKAARLALSLDFPAGGSTFKWIFDVEQGNIVMGYGDEILTF